MSYPSEEISNREEHALELAARSRLEANDDHTDECQLTCDHCRHGCYKACCWCDAVRDGEGEPQVECTCEVNS